ncbi:TonB-dependent receptor [Flavobacterium zepuense]|uniref:TonB-dependent receptor n=2 Tax=Flavobacterium zepuense TaxID=2593302 RepID=A0A552V2T7_9FLAO|nr:TonB-dependent receptor plug domain-containing protein [Flavobacterium zepuense]TRW24786.1 TonB-dependent receptor [Flavobacterium zepuense]
MKTINKLLTFTFLMFCTVAFAQKKPILYGIMIDETQKPIEGVSIYYDGPQGHVQTITDKTGFYRLEIPIDVPVTVYFSHISFALSQIDGVQMGVNDSYEFNSVLLTGARELPDVFISSKKGEKRVEGITQISPTAIRLIPGANAGVENIVKLLGGASGNNELSTGYNVRGGNYDENLVYVNDIEIYRPFLIRSGQQEGLSFTNSNMIENVDFSAGGFQARFGDKLSSVLDITYRKPVDYAATIEASFLGGSLTLEGISKDKKWTGIIGARYRDNSLLVNSQETETNFKPTFADVQSYITFTPNEKWEFTFLGNISQNKYHYQPLTRQTNFGTIDAPLALQIFYDGQEKDEYKTYFGAFTSRFQVSENFALKFIGSLYHTQEQEYFDILAQYALGEVDSNLGSETFGDIQFARGVGSQLNHARNNLDGLIANAEVKGYHDIGTEKKDKVEWGFKYTREDIRDRLLEYEVIDSAGFSLNPPIIDLPVNDQPYTPYTGPLVPYQSVRALNFVTIDRFSGYAQWSRRTKWGSNEIFLNAGVRANQWQVSGDDINGSKSQIVVSPRAQFSIKPKWDMNMLFRLSGGLYYQPPFYRELRDSVGAVRPDVKAQRSIHVVAANDYTFKLWERPFNLVTEAYYKEMDDVNTYTLENVRIRYRANNDAVAYAYGLDMRLNGEFVPGTESWVTIGYMKTEENINGRGYIARPTDQRVKVAILFQDYVPNIPSLKMYLNLVYNSGLPGGSPSYADSYIYQSRLNDYRRADAGFSYVFVDGAKPETKPSAKWLQPFKELALGLEIFNLFDNQNSITNTWVRDVYTKSQYGIPNYLTSRVFSLKLTAKI